MTRAHFAPPLSTATGPLHPQCSPVFSSAFSPLVCDHGTAQTLASQVRSPSLEVKGHAVWGVSLRNSSSRPAVDPFILALTATTVVCNEMLHDRASRAGQGGIGVNGLSHPPPSQVNGWSNCGAVRVVPLSLLRGKLWRAICETARMKSVVPTPVGHPEERNRDHSTSETKYKNCRLQRTWSL